MQLIRIFTIIPILVSNAKAQFMPSSVGVHHKKSSVSDASYVLDFNNNDTCDDDCTNSFYAEVPWSNMSTYSVSMWVKSGESNPSQFRAFFNTYDPGSNNTNDGFQMDSGGGNNPRYRYYYANGNTLSYGNNSLVTTWVHLAVVADGSQNETRIYYNGELVSGATFSGVEERWILLNRFYG